MSKNIFSNEALADWLSKKPANGTYNFSNIFDCVLCQYLKYAGLPVMTVGPDEWRDRDKRLHPLPQGWGRAVANGGPYQLDQPDWTYGGALKRLRELMREQEKQAA